MDKKDQKVVPQEIKDAFWQWGLTFFFGCVPQIAWFQTVRDFLRKLGWESVVWVLSVLLAALVWHVIAHRKQKKQIESLQEDLRDDVEHNLEPIKGRGFQRDKRNGEIICPSCKVKGAISYLRLCRGEFGDYYNCNGCGSGFDP